MIAGGGPAPANGAVVDGTYGAWRPTNFVTGIFDIRTTRRIPSIAVPRTPPSPPPGAYTTMLSRTTACRGAQRAARQQPVARCQRRGLAAPASGSFQYQAGEAKGVKYASRDFAGPTTTLALVAKAGTRFQPLPGLTEGLANFAFRVR